ncbi:MAG TPA: hypothetical protein VKY26_02180, partial [Actinomycetota bacterium]|nr:hypothetical protein [Actinomycetota bacterium]
LNDAGIPTGVLMAPILPGISDRPEQLAATVKAAADAGATHITPITLHLRPGVKEEFWPWLETNYPELVPTYESNYRRSYAKKEVGERIGAQVGELRRRNGVTATRASGGREPREGRAGPGPPDGRRPGPPGGAGGAEGPGAAGGPGQPQEAATGLPAGGAGAMADPAGPDEQLSLDLGAAGPRKVPRGLRTR